MNPFLEPMQRYGIKIVTPPVTELISLEDAHAHLRLDSGADSNEWPDDTWLANVGIPAARDWAERFMNRSVAQKTLELATNRFPGSGLPQVLIPARPYFPVEDTTTAQPGIILPMGPVISVEWVKYLDVYGVLQTFPDWELDSYSEPAIVNPIYGGKWPTARLVENAVRVRYVVGYGTANPLPPAIRAAMLLVLGHLYDNRENSARAIDVQEISLGASSLLMAYTTRRSMA